MIIKKLHIRSFGKLSDVTVNLSDDINLIHGSNEAGKTTLSVFMFAMLFDIEKPRIGNDKDIYTHYLPWNNPEEFGGEMEFEHEGRIYSLTRYFESSRHSTRLYSLSENREIYGGDRAFKEMLPGLSMNEYTSTWFQQEDSEEPDRSIAEGIKNKAREIVSLNDRGIDTAAALEELERFKKELGIPVKEKRIEELTAVIEEEEATEKKLDEIAISEAEGKKELKRLSEELEALKEPTDYEKREQEYYIYKERFQTYRQDIEESAELSEQLEETIRLGNELEKNSERLEESRKELASYRSFIKDRNEECASLRRDIESMNRIMLSESKNEFSKQIILMTAAALFIILGVVMLVMKSHIALCLCVFVLAVLLSGEYFLNMLKSRRVKKEKTEEIAEKKQKLHNTEDEIEAFVKDNPSEAALIEAYESCLKADGRRPEIAKKEEELGRRIKHSDEKLENRKSELLEFFKSFGRLESLKEDELKLQEEKLKAGKQERLSKLEKMKQSIDELSERLFRLAMQIEAGGENAASLMQHREGKAVLLEDLERSSREEKAIDMAAELISGLSSETHRSFGAEINKRASSYAAEFTDSRYSSFMADESLNLKVDYLDRYIPVDKLSRGTISQMKLALRMSAGDILLSDFGLPLVLDDVFVYFDETRLERSLSVICGHEGQKIILSCQTREEKALKKLGINFNLVLL